MIHPYKNPRPLRELGWLIDERTVVREYGVGADRLGVGHLDAALAEGVQVWGAADLLRELTRAGHGSAVLWRFVAIGWHPDRSAELWPVRGLQVDTPEDPFDVLAGLVRWRDWLGSYGAAPAGSLGGSGLSLVKATLDRPLWTSVGEVPPIRFTIGGRQETAQPAPAHYYGRLTHSDIAAAYAVTLGGTLYGGRWAKHGPELLTLLRRRADKNPGSLVYVRAVVELPELADRLGQLPEGHRGPLLDRPRSAPAEVQTLFWTIEERFPSGRKIQGTWTLDELETATDLAGARVRRVLDVWSHESGERPFARWLDAVWKGRELGGFAGRLAKATGNATWGQFAIAKGRRKVVAKGRSNELPLRGGNPSQRAFDLAEHIAGHVRAELYAGMLEAGPELVTAHTDGLWTSGPEIRGWRLDEHADELRIFDAQHYAYRLSGEPWSYTVAGELDPEDAFERRWADLLERSQPTPLQLASSTSGELRRRNAVAVIERER